MWLLALIFFNANWGFRLPIMRALILIGLLHLALKHARDVELVGLLTPLVLLPSLAPQIYGFLKRDYQMLSPHRLIPVMSLVALCGVVAQFALNPIVRSTDKITPAAALAAAKGYGASGPVFNSYPFGGYLIFSGIAPFIDSRADVYGDVFIKRYVKAETGNDVTDLTDLLDQYKIDWALVQPDSAVNLKFGLLPGWHKVFADDYSVVYIRTVATAGG
jgi:hypothetical protein